MKFFRTIWQTILSLLRKWRRSPVNLIFADAERLLEHSQPSYILMEEIKEVIDESKKSELISLLAEVETAKALIEIGKDTREVRYQSSLIPLKELRESICNLEIKRIRLLTQSFSIQNIIDSDISAIEQSVQRQRDFLIKHKSGNTINLVGNERDLIVREFSKTTTTIYRQKDRERKEKLYRTVIKKHLSNLDHFLKVNDSKAAKELITQLTPNISPQYPKELKRLIKAKQYLEQRELAVLVKRRDAVLRQQAEAVAKIQAEEEQRRIEGENKEKLIRSLLPPMKKDWLNFKDILASKNIDTFYHFTDLANIQSIKEHGGLFSWHYCHINNINIPKPGNSDQGRNLDRVHSLEDYVRLSFVKEHPMRYIALREGRIDNPVLLRISTEVAFLEMTRFSNKNAAAKDQQNSDTLEFLTGLRFDLFNKSYSDLNKIEKKFYQAEILVKTHIPSRYITNLHAF